MRDRGVQMQDTHTVSQHNYGKSFSHFWKCLVIFFSLLLVDFGITHSPDPGPINS